MRTHLSNRFVNWRMLLIIALAFFVLCLIPAHCQNARFDGVVQSRSGFPAPGALVAVCQQPCTVPANVSSVTPPAPLQPLCSSTSDVACVQPNPVQADGLGNYHFYVAPGRYTVVFYGTGLTARTQTDQIFPCDPSNCSLSNITLSGNLNAAALNGIVDAASQTGATLDVKLNACIAVAKTHNPHICDASNLGSGTIAAEVDVGDNATATPVALLLPPFGVWTVSITDGTSCGIKVFDHGILWGDATGGSAGFQLNAGVGANMDALVCTDPTPIGGGSYVLISGVMVENTVGATIASAGMHIQQTFDNSLIDRVTTVCLGCVGFYAHNLCCGLEIRSLQADGQSVAGSLPCRVGVTGQNTRDIHFTGHTSCVHPGNGLNAILVRGDSTWTENIMIDDLYMEPNPADVATNLAQISAGGPVSILQAHAANFGAGGNYLIDVASAAGNGQGFFLGTASVPTGGNAINDHAHGVTITGAVNQTVGPYGWGNVGAGFVLTSLTMKNNADAELDLPIDSGLTVAKTGAIIFRDRGVDKFSIQKDASNNAIYNTVGPSHFLEINSAVILRATANGNTFNVGVQQGSGFKHQRVAGCATAAAANATCDTTLTWTTTFADANYTATCSGNAATSGVPILEGTNISTAKVAASITIRTLAQTAAAAQFTTIDCIAVHD